MISSSTKTKTPTATHVMTYTFTDTSHDNSFESFFFKVSRPPKVDCSLLEALLRLLEENPEWEDDARPDEKLLKTVKEQESLDLRTQNREESSYRVWNPDRWRTTEI
jgi:hypothetical protein